MKRYLAKIIFRIKSNTEEETIGLFEVKLCLIHAESYRDAMKQAIAWGERDASEIINDTGQKVQWEFIAVPELKCIPEINDNIELCSHLEEMPVNEFIALQKDKQLQLSEVDV